jgi:exodeoxyribonuclease VII large subunit
LIVGRGGGSLEDLWAFNAEIVARAIAASQIPVISAVGHEKDVTIADLVADVRAPTPTKGAELVIAQRKASLDRLALSLADPAFTEPERWLKELREEVEEHEGSLLRGFQESLLQTAHRLRVLQGGLLSCSPQALILHQAERLHRFHVTLGAGMAHALEQTASRFLGSVGRFNALSPLAVLERGYSITFDVQGRILKLASGVKPGDRIHTQLHRGRVVSLIETSEG